MSKIHSFTAEIENQFMRQNHMFFSDSIQYALINTYVKKNHAKAVN